jgi:hypothetical protein
VKPPKAQRSSCDGIITRDSSKRHLSHNSPSYRISRRARFMSVAGNGAPALGATEDGPRQTQAEPTVMDGLSSSKVTGMHPCNFTAPYAYASQSSIMIPLGSSR